MIILIYVTILEENKFSFSEKMRDEFNLIKVMFHEMEFLNDSQDLFPLKK
jgi:hypothetical protein